MEFENWNRERLIEETQAAMIEAKRQPFKFTGHAFSELFSKTNLNQKTDQELRNMYVRYKSINSEFALEFEEQKERKRFFNTSECDADFDYWAKQAYWSIDEAIALILGKDPRKVFWDNIKEYLAVSPFVTNFNEIRESAKRYLSFKQLFNPSFPGAFLAWAERMKLHIPDKLREAVNTMGIQVCDWQSLYKDAEKLIETQNERINFLTKKCELLTLENTRLSEMPQFEMHPDDENYSTELDTANITYRMVIKNRDPQFTFKRQAKDILDTNYPHLTSDAKKRIAVVINSDKGKAGGRKPQE